MIIKRRYNINRILMVVIALTMAAAMFFAAQPAGKAAFSFTAIPYAPNIDTKVKLSWSSVPNALIYEIRRTNISANEAPESIKTVDVSTDRYYLSFIDTGLKPDTNYDYEITAFSDADMQHEIDSQYVQVTTAPIIKPVISSSEFDINNKAVTLHWANQSTATAGSIIEKMDAGGNEIETMAVISDTSTQHTFTDLNLVSGVPAYYAVLSTDSAGHTSVPSNLITITPIDPPTISAAMANGTVTVSWNASVNPSFFGLYRSKFNGDAWSAWTLVNGSISSGAGSVTDTPPTGGLFRYKLDGLPSSGYTGSSNITAPVTKPAAPKNIACALTAPATVTITWTNDANNESDYRIERKINSGNFTSVGLTTGSSTSFTDTYNFTTGNTYYYRVVAYDSNSTQAISTECSITPAAPSAPSGLRLVVISSDTIQLMWTDNSNTETSFRIERKTDSGDFIEIGSANPNATTYSSTNLTTGSTYIYRVRASNPIGYSGYTNTVSCKTDDSTAPSALTATTVSASSIDLAWTYPAGKSYNTIIERKTVGTETSSWAVITTTNSGTVKYTDTGLSANTRYIYRISAYLGSNVTSAFATQGQGVEAVTFLAAPSGLAGYATSSTQITLTWSDNSNETNFTVERKSGSGSFSPVSSTIRADTTSWTDTGLSADTQYTYRIKATTASNRSDYSNEITVTTTYLGAPSSLAATLKTPTVAELTWTDNSNNETGFEIWRCTNTASWAKYATVNRNTTTYTDSSLSPNTQYYYRVRAYLTGKSAYSAFSGTASVRAVLLAAPTDLDFSVVTATQINLSWTDNSSDESGFKIERKTGKSGSWVEIASVSPNIESYAVKDLKPYTEYYFRIKAYNSTYNTSAYSNDLAVMTGVPAAPSDLKLQQSTTSISLSWTDNSEDEDGFTIERKTTGEPYSELTQVEANVTAYADEGLEPGTRYYYRVKAFNKTGDSAYSKAVYVTTREVVTFDDIQDENFTWARDAVEALASMGIISGKSSNRFAPGDTITRAEFVCLMIRTYKLSKTPVGAFADVRPGQWFYEGIMTAKSFGIISPDGNNRFYPNEPITREDMAVVIAKTLKAASKPLPFHNTSVLNKFIDKGEISQSALSSFASLVGEGIVNGRGGSIIAPRASTTRAEAAVLIYKVMQL